MDLSTVRAQIASDLASRNFVSAVQGVETLAGHIIRGLVDSAVPGTVRPEVDAILDTAGKAAEDATADGLEGRRADILPDLIKDGEAGLVDLESSIGSTLSGLGIVGQLAEPVVKGIMQTVEAKLTAYAAPALSAAAGARVQARASAAPADAAAELAKVG